MDTVCWCELSSETPTLSHAAAGNSHVAWASVEADLRNASLYLSLTYVQNLYAMFATIDHMSGLLISVVGIVSFEEERRKLSEGSCYIQSCQSKQLLQPVPLSDLDHSQSQHPRQISRINVTRLHSKIINEHRKDQIPRPPAGLRRTLLVAFRT